MTALILAAITTSAIATGFLGGRLYEARDRVRSLTRMETLRARDVERIISSGSQPTMWRSFTGNLVDVVLLAVLALILAPVGYVGLRPVFAPRHRVIGKIELRAGPIGVPAPGQGELREARR